MDELVIAGKQYVSSKRAAQMTGYAKDYIGQLCRSGKIEAKLVGRNWYIEPRSLLHISSKKAKVAENSSSNENSVKGEAAYRALEESKFSLEPENVAYEADERPLVPEPRQKETAYEVAVVKEESAQNEESNSSNSIEEVKVQNYPSEANLSEEEEKVVAQIEEDVIERPSYVEKKPVRASKYAVDLRSLRIQRKLPENDASAPVALPEIKNEQLVKANIPTKRVVQKEVRAKNTLPSTLSLLGGAIVAVSIVLLLCSSYSKEREYPSSSVKYTFSLQKLTAAVVNSNK